MGAPFSVFIGGHRVIVPPSVCLNDMTSDELIAKAKEHICNVDAGGGVPGQLAATDFPKAKLRETAMVCFESEVRTDRVYVCLDRESGEFVTAFHWAIPGRAL